MTELEEKRNSNPTTRLHNLGYNLIPISGKFPPCIKWKKWQTERVSRGQMLQWHDEGFTTKEGKKWRPEILNWGLLTGKKPYSDAPGIVIVDSDDTAAEQLWHKHAPETPAVQITRRGKQFLYRRPLGIGYIPNRVKTISGGVEYNLDLRADGGYVLAPGSKHPSGHIYTEVAPWTAELIASAPVYDPNWLVCERAAKSVSAIISDPDDEDLEDWDEDEDGTPDDGFLALIPVEKRIEQARRYLEKVPGTQSGKGAHSTCYWVVIKILWGFALPVSAAEKLLCEWGERDDQKDEYGGHEPWTGVEIRHKLEDARKAKYRGRVGDKLRIDWVDGSEMCGEVAEKKKKLEIVVNGRQLRDVTADAITALTAGNDPPKWFARGGQFVRLTAGTAEPARLDTLKYVLAESADWFRAVKGNLVATYPPDDVIKNVLASPVTPLPPLDGVIRTPVFAPGGRLVSTPGYDPETRLYLDTTTGVTPPDQPTPEDVKAARAALLDVLVDFPFKGEADLAHAVALILLPFVRPMIDGPTPVHLIDAPSEGTGKGLLCEVFALITTGSPAKNTGEPRDNSEWGKVITAALMTAPPYIMMDNISRPINSPSFASATIARTYSDRQLGVSRMIEMEVNNVWLMTGNNVHGTREITRRFVRTRLDARCENPNLRTGFKYKNLTKHVSDHRRDLILACLVLVRAWVVAGCPRGNQILGSYEEWAGIMGGILGVAGIPGLLDNMAETMAEVNTTDSEYRNLVSVWWTVFGDSVVVAGELLRGVSTPGGDLILSALEGAGNPIIKMGFILAKLVGRVFGEYRIERATHPRGKAQGYRLTVAEGLPKLPKFAEVADQLRQPVFAGNPSESVSICRSAEVYPIPKTPKKINIDNTPLDCHNNKGAGETPLTSALRQNSHESLEIPAKTGCRSLKPTSATSAPTSANSGCTANNKTPIPPELELLNMRIEYKDGYVVQPTLSNPLVWQIGYKSGNGLVKWLDGSGSKEWAMGEVVRLRPTPNGDKK